MKTVIIILILTFSSYFACGQSYSLSIDSITKKHIDQLPKYKKAMFETILRQRESIDWLKRIDTTKFDYAFIIETFCYSDTAGQITERYFLKNDTIPKYLYIDGDFNDPLKVYDGFLIWYSQNVTYNYTLYPLIDNLSKLKSIQVLPYDKRQIWSHGCVVYKKAENNFKKKRTEQLKTTYQIQTMVDRISNRIIVSIQFAPTRPKFKTYGYNGVWDW